MIFTGFLVAMACAEDKMVENKEAIVKDSTLILLLRVDYVTNLFEGGHEQKILEEITNSDSILIKVDYHSQGDVDNITLNYQTSDNLLFNGSIIWHGKGEIKYPKMFNASTEYALNETSIDTPDDSRFQTIFYELPEAIDYSSIWNSISNLKIVAEYQKSKKKVGLFLYRPSVGIGNPKDWDWFVVMHK